ncbi:MAG: hypothetical protein GQ470_03455 [Gammaproteobacteria bacterium]|nr:hypothetical protein [Gammaproteobacteria bacterium]
MDLAKLGEGITAQPCEDRQDVAEAAVAQILQTSADAIAKRGAFHIVLAGGGTPKLAYQPLVGADTDWSRWHIYFGDERCLPADDPERNSVMV